MGYNLKTLVIGCGSIGERHIQNLKKLDSGKILACDLEQKRLNLMKKKFGVEIFLDINQALNQNPDLVFICTPPNSHIKIAQIAKDTNSHVFIEKPLSDSLNGIDALIKTAESKNLKIFTGYNFRFEKGMKFVKKLVDDKKIGRIFYAKAEFGQYLPDWRPWQDYKKSYTSKKNLGGGIILDGSHELDYIRWLLGEPESIDCYADKVSNLEVETEDVAKMLIRFKNGLICSVHLDFIRHGYTRNCELVGENGIIIWNFADKTVKFYDSIKKKWETKKYSDDVNDMYLEETEHVLQAIKNDKVPLVDGIDGKKTLNLALAAKKSAKSNRMVDL